LQTPKLRNNNNYNREAENRQQFILMKTQRLLSVFNHPILKLERGTFVLPPGGSESYYTHAVDALNTLVRTQKNKGS